MKKIMSFWDNGIPNKFKHIRNSNFNFKYTCVKSYSGTRHGGIFPLRMPIFFKLFLLCLSYIRNISVSYSEASITSYCHLVQLNDITYVHDLGSKPSRGPYMGQGSLKWTPNGPANFPPIDMSPFLGSLAHSGASKEL